ncbi:AMP-binding protein [Virgibacillus siamensis]|uniref:AMP-binding protein n=1 Tax=Virgibacillus siamensis TaxID=480071 RepID=UPI00098675B0|nr:AMP-binding protein [Virgibacillus siamensis]
MSIGINIRDMARKQPDKTAIMYEDHTISYQRFYRTICQLRQQLYTLPHQKETQKVAILIGNEPAFLELFFAVVTLGWTAIPFDPKWSKREAESIMNKAKPDFVFTSKQFSETAAYSFEAAYDIDKLKETPTNRNEDVWRPYEDKPFYLGFTSGSTGTPKGYIRSHKSWLASFTAAEKAFHYDHNAMILAPGPLCHSLSLFGAVHALHIGATFHLTSKFKPEATRNILHKAEGAVMYAVPTMLYALAAKNNVQNMKKLTFLSSGAKLNPEVKGQLQHVYPNSTIFEYYGASELSFVSYTPEKESESFSAGVGKPFPGVHITIRDKKGQCVPNGEIGKIFIDSDFLFSGYVNNPAETNEVLTRYGASVGDLGFLNDKGTLSIIGREKNMLISGGLNVYPEEVEKVIKEADAIQEAVVVGCKDDYWGQKIIALIQWKEHNQAFDLTLHCKSHLATYKIPKEFHHVTTFPYTSSGKIDRKEVQKSIVRLN